MNQVRHAGRIAALVAAVAVVATAGPRAEADKYQAYAVRFATLAGASLSSYVPDAAPDRRVDVAFAFWVLKGADGRVVLVDTGFHRPAALARAHADNVVSPIDAIAPLGIHPDDVTDIFLTDMNWDHAGGVNLFPSARVWVQKDEYDYCAGDAWQNGRPHTGVDADDVVAVVARNVRERVTFLRGDDDTSISGIEFHRNGARPRAAQWITAQTPHGVVVLAADAAPFYESLDVPQSIAKTLDARPDLRAAIEMRSLAARPELVVPGRDLAVFSRFPAVSGAIVRIE